MLSVVWLLTVGASLAAAQTNFEGRAISSVEVRYEGNEAEPPERFREIARNAIGGTYSAVKVRNAIEELYETKRVASVSVEAIESATNVKLTFLLRPLSMVRRVSLQIIPEESTEITEADILLRTNQAWDRRTMRRARPEPSQGQLRTDELCITYP